ncbi:UNVERIFIED_CONTAM: Transcriptional adapter ADA2 [Sesamum indicum]
MGRSRAASHAAPDDPGQRLKNDPVAYGYFKVIVIVVLYNSVILRSKRKRGAQNVENTESAPPEVPGITDGKKALYHCNYCNKDISGKIRIKCVVCSDFDLCVECFSVGAEVHPHKSNHPYRVMDNLAFPLICPDWNADEEMLLLEGIEMYGFGNWNEVAEHVGTKSKSQCIDHYDKIYMKSPCFPLPGGRPKKRWPSRTFLLKYLFWLDERKRRKDFILERNLLYPDPFEKDLTSEEKELCNRYRVFMRFHSKEEHDELLRSIVEEQRILKRIQDLQEARAAGCRTSAEAERYIEQKMKREIEENARRVKESSQAGPSGKYLQRMNHHKGEQDSSPRGGNNSPSVLDPGGKDSSTNTRGLNGSDPLDNWDVSGFLGADMLSEAEKQLCGEMRILPTHYLNMLQTMSIGILNGNVTKKSDAHGLFNVDPVKVDKVYDMLIRKGIAQT